MINIVMGLMLSISGVGYINENHSYTQNRLLSIANVENSDQQNSSEKNDQIADNIYINTATENNKIILLAAIISVSCFFFLILSIVIIYITKQKIKNNKLFNDLAKY